MTEKFGLIGYPLGHSFSKRYFTEKFLSEGIDAIYSLYPLENISEFTGLIARETTLKGLNVTIPYKEAVKGILDDLSEEAKAIGAVNVVKIDRRDEDMILTGYNSDYIGFSESLKPLLTPGMKRALVLGTGGA
nr:shikimate dehydrogenase [Muribaculaceae bacterium]